MKRTKRLNFVIILVISIIAILNANNEINANRLFDVYDEGAHLDYAIKLSMGHLPAWGNHYDQETLKLVDCTGTAFTKPGDCTSHFRNPLLYSPNGYSYEVQQPFLAYLPYALALKIIPVKNLTLSNIRRVGILWIVLSSFFLYQIFLILRLKPLAVSSVSSILLLNANFTHAVSTVTNDAANATFGIIACWLLLRIICGKTRKSEILIVSILMGLSKILIFFVPFSVLLFIFLVRIQNKSNIRLNAFLTSISKPILKMFFCTSLTILSYLILQIYREAIPNSVVLKALNGYLVTARPHISTYTESIEWSTYLFKYNIVNILLIAILGISVGLIISHGSSKLKATHNIDCREILLWSGILSTVITAILMPAIVYLQGKYSAYNPPRYGLGNYALLYIGIFYTLQESKLSVRNIFKYSSYK